MSKARKQKTKSFKQSVLIVCPGLTEKGYINALKKDRYKGMSIEVIPKLGHADRFQDVFRSLREEFKYAKDSRLCFYLNDLDAISAQCKLAVYEQDRDKTIRASCGKLTVVDSMPCIEFWFRLHFTYTDRYYANWISLKPELRKFITDYDKNTAWAKRIYNDLKDRIDEAITNSEKTIQVKKTCGRDCSYTNMYELLKVLDGLHEIHNLDF